MNDGVSRASGQAVFYVLDTFARAGNVGDPWTLFVRHPLLALAPAALFFALAARNRRRFNLVVGGIWAAYALYELGTSLGILCSGECNIRADLILFYPVLAVLSLIGLVMAFRGRPGTNGGRPT